MKTFIIILSIIIGLTVLWIFIVNITNKKAAKNARNINPLDWLSTNSFMGFQLLDNWEFVLSRMHHLGLISINDLGGQKMAYLNKRKEVFTLNTTINNLKNIDHITFDIYRGKLCGIGIMLKVDAGQNMDDLKRSLYAKFSTIYGKPSRVMVGYVWEGNDGSHISIGTDYDGVTIGIPRTLVS